jgi:hypothetical protein
MALLRAFIENPELASQYSAYNPAEEEVSAAASQGIGKKNLWNQIFGGVSEDPVAAKNYAFRQYLEPFIGNDYSVNPLQQ